MGLGAAASASGAVEPKGGLVSCWGAHRGSCQPWGPALAEHRARAQHAGRSAAAVGGEASGGHRRAAGCGLDDGARGGAVGGGREGEVGVDVFEGLDAVAPPAAWRGVAHLHAARGRLARHLELAAALGLMHEIVAEEVDLVEPAAAKLEEELEDVALVDVVQRQRDVHERPPVLVCRLQHRLVVRVLDVAAQQRNVTRGHCFDERCRQRLALELGARLEEAVGHLDGPAVHHGVVHGRHAMDVLGVQQLHVLLQQVLGHLLLPVDRRHVKQGALLVVEHRREVDLDALERREVGQGRQVGC